MEAIKLDIIDVREDGSTLINLAGTRNYKNRAVIPDFGVRDECLDNLRVLTDNGGVEAICSSLIHNLYHESQIYPQYIGYETKRYFEVLPDIWIDKFNTLELCGAMSASKEETILYSFHDKFAEIIAFLFREDAEVVKRKLLKNCETYGVDYRILSYAFCTRDIKMIESINLQSLVGICDLLDLFIEDIFWYSNPSICTVRETCVDIADIAFTPEERVTTYLISNIACVQQSLLNQIVRFFYKGIYPFNQSKNCMMCSKGFGNIVITAQDTSVFPDVTVTLGDNTFNVSPMTYLALGGQQ